MNANAMVAGALFAVTVLAGCGGGSSGTSAPPAPPAISAVEGLYQGTIAEGSITVMLENGQYFAIYGEIASGRFVTYGLVEGSGTASNGTFSSTNSKDYYKAVVGVDSSLNATYSPDVSFNGTISGGGEASSSFTSVPLARSAYDYKTAANLADIAGSWSMVSMRDEYFKLNITPTGAITGTTADEVTPVGCELTGTIAPRPSGKNVFNVSLTFGPAPCALPGQSFSGIGVGFILADGRHELLMSATEPTRTYAVGLAGAR